MIGLSVRGRFWQAEKPEASATGRLTISEEQGALLELDGSIREGFRVRVHPIRRGHDVQFGADYQIHGEVDGRPVTLGWCKALNFRPSEPERYKAGVVYLGGHFDEGLSAEFDTASLRMRYTELWFASDGGVLPTETESSSRADWRLDLVTEGSPRLQIAFNAPRPVDQTVEIFRALSYFVTTCLDTEEASVARITLSDSLEDHPEVELYVPFMRSDTSGSLDSLEPEEFLAYRDEMLLSYEDIGGIDGLANWVEVAKEFRPVVSLLSGIVDATAESSEGRFIKYCIASEAFARIRNRSDRVNLAKDLEAVAQEVSDGAFASFSGSRTWPGVIAEARNQFVVHRGPRGNYDPLKLHWLAEVLRLLVVFALLRRCGVATDKVDACLRGTWFDHLAERVREVGNWS